MPDEERGGEEKRKGMRGPLSMTHRCVRIGRRANCVARACVPPALTKAPPVGHDGMQVEYPAGAAPLKVAGPTDTRPAAPQPVPTQVPAGFATAQPRAAHALASMAVHALPGRCGVEWASGRVSQYIAEGGRGG